MKKLSLLSLLAVLLLVSVFATPVPVQAINGSVRNINTGETFLTIPAAINDADTLDGHTILVGPGTYSTPVVVNKAVTIKSTQGPWQTTIDVRVDPDYYYCFKIMSNNVKIIGFTLTSYEYGIIIDGVEGTVISGNIIRDNPGPGIFLDNADRTSILGNKILENALAGIKTTYADSDRCLVTGNLIRANGEVGIFWKGQYNKFLGNKIVDNTHDNLQLYFTSRSLIMWNVIRGSDDGEGLMMGDCNYNQIVGNRITRNDGHGIVLAYCYANLVKGNKITENGGDGLKLDECYDTAQNRILWNTITCNGGDGIYCDFSNDNLIRGNNVKYNDDNGIAVEHSTGNTINRNRVFGNANYDLWTDVPGDNTWTYNYYGDRNW